MHHVAMLAKSVIADVQALGDRRVNQFYLENSGDSVLLREMMQSSFPVDRG